MTLSCAFTSIVCFAWVKFVCYLLILWLVFSSWLSGFGVILCFIGWLFERCLWLLPDCLVLNNSVASLVIIVIILCFLFWVFCLYLIDYVFDCCRYLVVCVFDCLLFVLFDCLLLFVVVCYLVIVLVWFGVLLEFDLGWFCGWLVYSWLVCVIWFMFVCFLIKLWWFTCFVLCFTVYNSVVWLFTRSLIVV